MKTNKLILRNVLAGLITATAPTSDAESSPPANSTITWTAGGKPSKMWMSFSCKRRRV